MLPSGSTDSRTRCIEPITSRCGSCSGTIAPGCQRCASKIALLEQLSHDRLLLHLDRALLEALSAGVAVDPLDRALEVADAAVHLQCAVGHALQHLGREQLCHR